MMLASFFLFIYPKEFCKMTLLRLVPFFKNPLDIFLEEKLVLHSGLNMYLLGGRCLTRKELGN